MISNILNDSISRLKAEKQASIDSAVAANKTAVVQPKFAEIEKAKNEAIEKINADAKSKITAYNQSAEEAKTAFEESQKETITASVGASYDTAISMLQTEYNKYSGQ